MKTVKLNVDVKGMFDGSGTFDEQVNRLIDSVEDDMGLLDYDLFARKSIVNLNEDTLDRLRSFSVVGSESVESIIVRMLIQSRMDKK